MVLLTVATAALPPPRAGSAPCEDITTVFVLPEWAETWDGLQAMEEECLDANSVLGMHGVVAACSRKQSCPEPYHTPIPIDVPDLFEGYFEDRGVEVSR